MSEIIDLRSDTVTQPSPEMRQVMAKAPVGDDQFGEDPSINLLQERIAQITGKDAALWIPSGTMANQIALRVLTHPGDDVIVSQESHAVWHETGGSAANAGVQLSPIGSKGLFTVEEFTTAIKPRGHIIYPPTTLVEIENTHNRGGGIIFPQDEIKRICKTAKEHEISTYLDGARLWNVSSASGKSMDELAKPFDLVSVALSKGLGVPGGSVLAGSKDIISRCVRHRRMLGGAMRQVGFFGAAGLYALEHNIERLAEDHDNARLIAERLASNKKFVINLDSVQTNILVFDLADDAPDASTVVNRAKEKGLLIFAFGPRTIRAVTHLDVSKEACLKAVDIFDEIVK